MVFKPCQWKYIYRNSLIICHCECHSDYQEMLDMIAESQTSEDAPLGAPSRAPIPPYEPVLIDDRPRSSPLSARPIDMGGHELPGRVFKVNASGRAARGQLEESVRVICAKWHELFQGGLTPEVIGGLINKESPPSPGGIHAVITRWEQKGLCTLAAKPFHFVGFTDKGKRELVY